MRARCARDFPIFEQEIHGKPLAFLDSAASSQKPRQVLDAMTAFYETSYANVHRGVYVLAERATEALEHAREQVRAFLNAPDGARDRSSSATRPRRSTSSRTRGASANLGPGDLVVVTELEHHSNFVPWQFIAGKTGAELADDPARRPGRARSLRSRRDRRAAATSRSSRRTWSRTRSARSTRSRSSPRGRTRRARSSSATPRSRAPHITVDVQALGVDFVAISGHKMCGPSGVGALWGRAELLQAMDPFLTGGHMISSVRLDKTTWGELPHKFEAGTAPMAEAVGFGAAIDYLEAVGFDAIEAHEHELAAYALGRLSEMPGITLYGPPADRRAGIVSFNIEGIHPHDVAQILDMQGVAIRAGHHCCQPLMQKLGVAATNRASFYLYTVQEEIDQLVDGLHAVRKVFA